MVSNEEKMLKERIRHMLTYKRMTIAKLSDNDTMRVRLGRQINGPDTSVPFSTLYMLLDMFPDIDANWLILGEGGMTRAEHLAPRIYNHNDASNSRAGGSINVGTSTIPYPVQALLDEKDKRISELEKDKEKLQGLLAVFTAQAQSHAPKPKK